MKNIIIAFIVGILITVFSYHAYTVYKFKKTLTAHDIAIAQIVNLINSSLQANDRGSK